MALHSMDTLDSKSFQSFLHVPDFPSKFIHYLGIFQQNLVLCDCFIHCCDGIVSTHKLILALWGLKQQVAEDPNLKATSFSKEEITHFLGFLYTGKASYSMSEIQKFQDIGHQLGIRFTAYCGSNDPETSDLDNNCNPPCEKVALEDYITNFSDGTLSRSEKQHQISILDIIINFEFENHCQSDFEVQNDKQLPKYECEDPDHWNVHSSSPMEEDGEQQSVNDTEDHINDEMNSPGVLSESDHTVTSIGQHLPVKQENSINDKEVEIDAENIHITNRSADTNLSGIVGEKEDNSCGSEHLFSSNVQMSSHVVLMSTETKNDCDKLLSPKRKPVLVRKEKVSKPLKKKVANSCKRILSKKRDVTFDKIRTMFDSENLTFSHMSNVSNNQQKELIKNEESPTSSHLEKSNEENLDCEPDQKGQSELKTTKSNTNKVKCRYCKDKRSAFYYIHDTEAGQREYLEHKLHNHPQGLIGPEPLKCDICGFAYVGNTEVGRYLMHRYRYHGESFDESKFGKLTCKEEGCSFWTLSKRSLRVHKGSCHPPACMVCSICGVPKKTKFALRTHIERHQDMSKREKFPCEICGKLFLNHHSVKGHVNRVHNNNKRAINCYRCSRSFDNMKQCYDHMVRVHREQLPSDKKYKLYSCDKCDFVTLMRNRISQHEKLHMKQKGIVFEKQHACDICGKEFDRLHDVKQHKANVHVAEVSCPYPGCKRICKPAGMKRHIDTFHKQKGRKDFACHLCDYKSVSEGNVRKHLRGVHKEEVTTLEKLKKQVMSTGTGFYEIELKQNELRCRIMDKSKNQ